METSTSPAEPQVEASPSEAVGRPTQAAGYAWLIASWLDPIMPRLLQLSRWSIAGLSAYYVGLFLFIAAQRANYPFDLEWMEGAVIDHVRVVLERGHPFVEPTLEFAPFIYNPGYYYLTAVFSWVVGLDFLAGRLVSILSWLAVLGLCFELVRRETGQRAAGALTAGLLAASYALADGWFDLARVDSLLLALMVLAAFWVRFASSRRGLIGAGLVLFAAFTVKQVALGLVPPLALYVLLYRGARDCAWFTAACLLPCGAFVLLMNWWSDGWYWYYAFEIPATHVSAHKLDRWKRELFGPFSLSFPFAFSFFVWPTNDPATQERRVFHGLVALALGGIAVLARGHTGSWFNDNVTAYIGLCVLTGMGAAPYLVAQLSQRTASLLATAVLAGQFVILHYQPGRWYPKQADFDEASWLAERIASYPGQVYLPHHGHVGPRAGKNPSAHDMALYDIKRAKVDFRDAQKKLRTETQRALREHRYDAIITDRPSRAYVHPKLIKRYYRQLDDQFVQRKQALFTRSGIRIRPHFLFEPK